MDNGLEIHEIDGFKNKATEWIGGGKNPLMTNDCVALAERLQYTFFSDLLKQHQTQNSFYKVSYGQRSSGSVVSEFDYDE